MKPIRLAEACQFRSDKFLPELLHGSTRARVFALCLEPGQRLDPRPDSEEAFCFLIEGTGEIHLQESVFPIEGGEFAVAPAGAARGLEAQTRCLALWVQLSSKDAADG
jgi:quercetin dioxygenase-like cupin family protein